MARRTLRIALACAVALMAPASADAFVYTVAGNGDRDSLGPGDGLPATDVPLGYVRKLAYEADGGILISDWGAVRVRRVGNDGRISTVAGPAGAIPPGGAVPDDHVAIDPGGMAPLGDLSFLLALGDGRIQRIARDGSKTTVASGFRGARDVAVLPDGGFLVAAWLTNSIARVYPDGHSETVAGSGPVGRKEGNFGGDGGPATEAKLMLPEAVTPTPDGGFVIADTENWRVRKVGPDGVITTIAGDGVHGVGALEGKPATSVAIGPVHDVALRPDGTLLIAATKVLELKPDGTLAVVYPEFADAIAPMPDGGLLIRSRPASSTWHQSNRSDWRSRYPLSP